MGKINKLKSAYLGHLRDDQAELMVAQKFPERQRLTGAMNQLLHRLKRRFLKRLRLRWGKHKMINIPAQHTHVTHTRWNSLWYFLWSSCWTCWELEPSGRMNPRSLCCRFAGELKLWKSTQNLRHITALPQNKQRLSGTYLATPRKEGLNWEFLSRNSFRPWSSIRTTSRSEEPAVLSNYNTNIHLECTGQMYYNVISVGRWSHRSVFVIHHIKLCVSELNSIFILTIVTVWLPVLMIFSMARLPSQMFLNSIT